MPPAGGGAAPHEPVPGADQARASELLSTVGLLDALSINTSYELSGYTL